MTIIINFGDNQHKLSIKRAGNKYQVNLVERSFAKPTNQFRTIGEVMSYVFSHIGTIIRNYYDG